jgi:hypothetical protein
MWPSSLDLPTAPPLRRRWLAAGAVLVLLSVTWSAREPLAERLITRQLAAMQVPGSYRIIALTPARQELADVVLGDPAHPDLTARRLVLHTGLAGVAGLEIDGLRLFGRVQGGRLSLGSLDRWLAQPSAPPTLPDWPATVRDARVSIGGEWGNVGLALAGSGNLADGFAGPVAGYAPRLDARHCRVDRARLGGMLATHRGQIELHATLLGDLLACKGAGLTLRAPQLALAARIPASMAGGMADLRLTSAPVTLAGLAARSSSGQGRLDLTGGELGGSYRLALDGVSGAGITAQRLETSGRLGLGAAGLLAQGCLAGTGLALAPSTLAAMDNSRQAARGSPVGPLLDQMVARLRQEGRAGSLAADYALSRDGTGIRLAVPSLHWRGHSGAILLAGTGLGLGADGAMDGVLELGGWLPRLHAQLAPQPGGTRAQLTLAAPLRAGGSTLALPAMSADWDGRRLNFAGRVEVSGAVPQGRIERLALPLQGQWSARGGLLLGQRCQRLGFAGLTTGALALGPGAISLCPSGPALLARGQLAARVPGLALAGSYDGQPLKLGSGPLMLNAAGLTAQRPGAVLGTGAAASRLAFTQATVRFGPQLSGTVAGGAGQLAGAPVAVSALALGWRLAGGRLVAENIAARLADLPEPGALPRFNPFDLTNGQATLADGHVQAAASLRHPASGRVLAELTADHAVASRSGAVRIVVPGLLFDPALQPAMLSPLAEGVAENVAGRIDGAGRIDWAGGKLTSSGTFATKGLDLAVAFGPVRGVAGQVEFTDLLGLVTAPDQQLRIAAINPGIEVDDGVLHFALAPGRVLQIEGGEWPFLSGHLRLRPGTMTLGATEVRRYVLEADGIDAGELLQRLDLPNLSVTGRFDGVLPLVFDADGGRAVGGQLVSRRGGGNVSYVGALTYKDLSPMANFAFQTLRSLDYQRMRIGIDGSLAGEVVTRVEIEGVKQGKLARRNLLTRQLGRLPIRFNVNVRGNFYEVIQSMAATYDPLALCRLLQNRLGVTERARLGLATDCGRIAPAPASPNAAQPPVQPSSSEHRP